MSIEYPDTGSTASCSHSYPSLLTAAATSRCNFDTVTLDSAMALCPASPISARRAETAFDALVE
eukprot:CAMPEP_0169426322 /NCGR_PEP_ID=MMETSP1042-20121227/138_1 /TAXON_ID=464988 /ORGANISM="Hemiselmis andersenii, Strain CCMP1180" /LENGTH=63 /DNA_ID=CAMNT_0009536231 /DNA_START=281 /DNA_END=472 /DNA_ORIENTATION=-